MLPEVNLLPRRERRPAIFYYIFIAGLAVCVLFSAFMIFRDFQVKSHLKEAEAVQSRLELEKASFQSRLGNQSNEQTVDLEQVVTYLDQNRLPTSILIGQLIVMLPDNAYFNAYEYDLETMKVEMQFDTIKDVSTYTKVLEGLPLVENVHLEDVQASEIKKPSDATADVPSGVDYGEIPRYVANFTFHLNKVALLLEAEDRAKLTEKTEPVE